MQISIQFDEFFNKNFKILISLGFEVFIINKTCWDTQYDENSNVFLLFQILDLIVFICVMCSGAYFRNIATGTWTDFVAMTGFWVSGLLLIFYLLHVMEKFHVIPWMMIEMGFCCLWSFFFFTCSIDMAVQAGKYANASAYAAGAFFGFAAMIVYGFDGFLKFKGWRAGQLAQGERVVQQAEAVTY